MGVLRAQALALQQAQRVWQALQLVMAQQQVRRVRRV
jgi:hypothetical protein